MNLDNKGQANSASLKGGADYIVVGRAIVAQADPLQSALDILAEIEQACR